MYKYVATETLTRSPRGVAVYPASLVHCVRRVVWLLFSSTWPDGPLRVGYRGASETHTYKII